MGLTEYLSIANLFGLAVLIVILLVTRRPGRKDEKEDISNGQLWEAIAAMNTKTSEDTATEIQKTVMRENASLKTDVLNEVRASRTETVGTVRQSVRELGESLTAGQKATNEAQEKLIASMNEGLQGKISTLTETQDKQMTALLNSQNERMDALHRNQNERMSAMAEQIRDFNVQSRNVQEETRKTVETRLSEMQKQNTEQLDKMRETVDEKLQKTLEERINQSFKTVNDQLTAVYQGLGEMKALAGSVGDLKKVMTGVKTRGILGELQLGSIIEDILSPEQYGKNIATVPHSRNVVEYAVILPGDGKERIYLPIDSKFPGDTYQHLMDAYESCDMDAVKAAQTALVTILKKEAKDIQEKYVKPPYTTNFGVMFLPTEGLYAEAVRLGLAETLRQTYDITLAGPTTLAALLNSLQMGFRTLAIQKQSGEVWKVLGAVKTELASFEKTLTEAQDSLKKTGLKLDSLVGTRTHKLNSKLKSVTELTYEESEKMIENEDGFVDSDE